MIAAERLDEIAGWLKGRTLDEGLLPDLRQHFPHIHFTWCMDDDICNESVALEEEAFNLYLVDGHEHCLKFTTDPATATGVVIAERTDD